MLFGQMVGNTFFLSVFWGFFTFCKTNEKIKRLLFGYAHLKKLILIKLKNVKNRQTSDKSKVNKILESIVDQRKWVALFPRKGEHDLALFVCYCYLGSHVVFDHVCVFGKLGEKPKYVQIVLL